jgi:hypothetical protein
VQAVKDEESFAKHVDRWIGRLEVPLALTGGLILLAAVAYGVGDVVLAPVPIARRAGLEELVLGSATVVAAIRVAVIFAAGFFVVSVVALAVRRQRLVRVGPVEVSERVSNLAIEGDRIEESLENAMQTIDSLRYELAVSNTLLDRAMDGSGE